jgi:hypothetical protein
MAKDFTMTLLVDQSPEDVFNAVRNVREWWQGFYGEEINGKTESLNDEFTFRAGDGAHYTKQKLVEVIPNERVTWLVTTGELTFAKKKDEWEGTKIVFKISQQKNKTQLQFIHEGLIPEMECYDACSTAWRLYLQEKLLSLIQLA